MSCTSTIPRKPNSDTSWCDGSDDLAYQLPSGQAVAVRGDNQWVGKVYTKIEHLPTDHWHATSEVEPHPEDACLTHGAI